MPYATKTDIDQLYGDDLLKTIADRDGDGLVDEKIVTRALAEAEGEIDAYLEKQYDIPVSPVPLMIRKCCTDIAIYRIVLDGGMRSDEHRLRYEDAIKFLDKIAAGKVGLGIGSDDVAEGETAPASRNATFRVARG